MVTRLILNTQGFAAFHSAKKWTLEFIKNKNAISF